MLFISDLKLILTHRYEDGIKSAVIDDKNRYILALSASGTVSCTYLRKNLMQELVHEAPEMEKYSADEGAQFIIIHGSESEFSHNRYCYLPTERRYR